MSKDIDWNQLISSTRKSAFCAAEFSVSLYELVTALESEAKKPQEPKDDGPENPPTST